MPAVLHLLDDGACNGMNAFPESSVALRLLVAYARPLTRKGMETVLSAEPGFAVVSVVGDGALAIAGIRRHRPDICVIGTDLPDIGGLNVLTTIMRDGLATKILLMAECAVGEQVYEAMKAGACGYFTTQVSTKDICNAIRGAAGGHRTFSAPALAALQEYLLQRSMVGASGRHATLDRRLLTARELQVLRCMADGTSIARTGRLLHISESTVKNLRHSIFAKLGVSNAPAAVSTGLRSGILPALRGKKVS